MVIKYSTPVPVPGTGTQAWKPPSLEYSVEPVRESTHWSSPRRLSRMVASKRFAWCGTGTGTDFAFALSRQDRGQVLFFALHFHHIT